MERGLVLWWQYTRKWDLYSNTFSRFERGYARNMHFDFEQNHKNIQVCSLNVAHSTIKLSWGGEEIGLTQITLFIHSPRTCHVFLGYPVQ